MPKKLEGFTIPVLNPGPVAMPKDQIISLTNRIAVAADDIEPLTVGEAWLCGVFDLTAVAAEQYVQGAVLYADIVAQTITTVALGNVPAGFAYEAKAAGETTVRIKLFESLTLPLGLQAQVEAIEQRVYGTPTVTVGDEAADAIVVTVQLNDAANNPVAEQCLARVWLSDAAAGALCAVAPSGNVVVSTAGVIVASPAAKTHLLVASDATGAFDISITEAGAKVLFFNVEYQGYITSAEVEFA